jgi:hypothetical protein
MSNSEFRFDKYLYSNQTERFVGRVANPDLPSYEFPNHILNMNTGTDPGENCTFVLKK